MEGRCRSTTSTAWTGLVLIGLSSSRGSGKVLPVKTSCSKCQLTRETNFIDTLKGRSFPPSPGNVTSKSTWVSKKKNSSSWILEFASLPSLFSTQNKRHCWKRTIFFAFIELESWERSLYNLKVASAFEISLREGTKTCFLNSGFKHMDHFVIVAINHNETASLCCRRAQNTKHVLQVPGFLEVASKPLTVLRAPSPLLHTSTRPQRLWKKHLVTTLQYSI